MDATLLPERTKKASLMKTKAAHLTYCTNKHAGEIWSQHFEALQQHLPAIKQKIAPHQPFGVACMPSICLNSKIVGYHKVIYFGNI